MIASQIAAALEYAHEKGVSTRSETSKHQIAADGAVKILDFGLAKVLGADAGDQNADLSHYPTLIRGTQARPEVTPIPGTVGAANPCFSPDAKWDPGTVMVTIGCMSPEQLKALGSHHRVDDT